MNSRFNFVLKRSAAYFIDVTIIYLIVMLVFQLLVLVPIREYIGLDENWFRIGWNVQVYVWVTISLPVWLYFIVLESSNYKATLGKRLFKLRVVNDTHDSKLPLQVSVKRTALKLLPWELIHIGLNLPNPVWFEDTPSFRYLTLAGTLLFVFYFITILVSKRRTTIYDDLIKTKVIPI